MGADLSRKIGGILWSLLRLAFKLVPFALLVATAACTGENQQFQLPSELTVRGSFVAALDDDGHTYKLDRILLAERFPDDIETVLHFTMYEETATSVEQATELAKRPFLYVKSPHVKVLARDFVSREWHVVWFRTLTPEEEDNLLK
jgi:hypothetical protein